MTDLTHNLKDKANMLAGLFHKRSRIYTEEIAIENNSEDLFFEMLSAYKEGFSAAQKD